MSAEMCWVVRAEFTSDNRDALLSVAPLAIPDFLLYGQPIGVVTQASEFSGVIGYVQTRFATRLKTGSTVGLGAALFIAVMYCMV